MSGAHRRKAERARLLSVRLAMTEGAHGRASAAVLAVLTARYPPGSLGLVAGYWPIRREVDPLPYLHATLEAGGRVALPVATDRRAPLSFRAWTADTPMEAGRWNILHPAEGEPVTPDTLLIPLVGFDAAGHRLGYGGGYYDRTLAALKPRPLAIGLGFEAGRLESVDPAAHDQPLDMIVTEAGVFETN